MNIAGDDDGPPNSRACEEGGVWKNLRGGREIIG